MVKVLCRRFALLLLVLWLAVGAAASVAAAQGAVDLVLSTRYPGISARPGDSLSFSLDLKSVGAPTMADIRVAAAPEGWETILRGGGSVIHKVYANPDSASFLDLKVEVPKDAEPGNYKLDVVSESSVGTRRLPLEVRVEPIGSARAELVAQYPALQGPAGAQFDYRVTLKNTGGTKQLFSLAAQAPRGWEVAIHPAYQDKRIANISVDAGGSESLDIKVTTPRQVAAGEYEVALQAVGDGVQDETRLKVVITGSYDLRLEPATGRYNATVTASKEGPVNLEVRNTGTAPLQNINFSHYAPSNWKVTFTPERLDTLEPGESRQVQAVIQPGAKTIAGDYVVSFTASTNEASRNAEFRVAVETPTVWGWVGVGLIVMVVAGVGATFRYYGRR